MFFQMNFMTSPSFMVEYTSASTHLLNNLLQQEATFFTRVSSGVALQC